jgi:DNA-binding CsgD family transcriptional regulator
MARRLSSPVFAGRVGELDELVRAIAAARDGVPGVVLLGGEAGLGKTRLVRELVQRAGRDGACVLSGACVSLDEAAIPLLPVADALGGLEDGDGGVPALAMPPRLVDAEPGAPVSMRVGAGVLERLGQTSVSVPVLLVVEDVHWADRSTLDVLTFLARRVQHERILVVVTFRSDEVDRNPGLQDFLADLGTAPAVQRLELSGLTFEEMREQVSGLIEGEPAPGLLEAVFARSEGNPFFAEELVALGQHAAGGLSPSLRDVLLARIGRLGADAQSVVGVAAVGGREVHHRLLAEAAGLADPELTAALREAVRHHVLVATADRFGFRHALVQEVAYGELLPGERARLHAGFARALQAGPATTGETAATRAAEIAHHWLRAGDEPRALAAAVRAGIEAECVGALAEAADHHTRALSLWEVVADAERVAGVDLGTLLTRAAHCTAWTGRPADAIRLTDAAMALVDPDAEPMRAAMLHERRGLYLYQVGRAADGVPDLERAVALIPPEPPSAERARAVGRLGFILLLAGQYPRSREVSEAAVPVARAVGARLEEADALASLGQALSNLGESCAGLECLRLARSIALEQGEHQRLGQTAIGLSYVLHRDGQPAAALEIALAGAEEGKRAGLAMSEGICRLNAAAAAHELGRWDLADRLTREVLDRDLTGTTLAGAREMAAALALSRGDLDAAEGHLAARRSALGPDPAGPDVVATLRLEAELAIWRGCLADASRAAGRGLTVEPEDPVERLELAALGVRAEADRAAIARARRDEAAEAAAREGARAFRDAARRYTGAARHACLSAVAECDYSRAEGLTDPEAWGAAARTCDQRPAPYLAAYARWREADAALAVRDRAGAASALRSAYATTNALGAAALQRELEALARRARINLPPTASTPSEEAVRTSESADAAGLTPRELEVLEHIALGETDRQIASSLFISVKTAGTHVSHILGKLDAANRGEAAAAAHRLRLVP